MDLLKTYLTAIDFSQNALKSIIHRYKIQTFLDIDSIPITVAEDLFFKMQEENDDSQKQDEEFERETKEFEREVEREKARILRNLLRYFGGTK